MESIKIPAIRGKIGNTVFYCTTLTFKQISTMVKTDNELQVTKSVKENLFTNSYIKTKEYILNQENRFVNSLVLVVYDGNPMWKEVRVDIENETYYNYGLLELTGQEKILPIEDQHRVEGIKAALQVNQELEREAVGVIILGVQTNHSEKTNSANR